MTKVIIFGLKHTDVVAVRDFLALQKNGEIEIVAEITDDDKPIFNKKQSIEKAISMEFDVIVVYDKDISLIKEMTKGSNNVVTYSDFIRPHYEAVENKQKEILKQIIVASEEEISDREWLKDKIYAYGFQPYKKAMDVCEDEVYWTTHAPLQVPEEFLDFCMYLSTLKCENAIEIGVFNGKTGFFIAAVLYRNNKNLKYDMVDICDHLDDFDAFKKIIPAIQKRVPNTSDDFKGKKYDFAFIDGDHRYIGVMRDWNNVGKFAKMVCFHDIYAHEYDKYDGGTVRAWQELSQGRDIKEFSCFKSEWMGIGVINMKNNIGRGETT